MTALVSRCAYTVVHARHMQLIIITFFTPKHIQMIMLSLEDGTIAVKTARKVIKDYLKTNRVPNVEIAPAFNEPGGVFVTLKTMGDLRGCIGYPYPDMPLGKALVDAAVQAATQDPRFPRVTSRELEDIDIEVTLLSEPELLRVPPLDRPKAIKIGRDGLIIERGLYRGLLLPQVPVEQRWGPEEFLEGACLKAGLMPDMWVDDRTNVYTFTGQIFAEKMPGDDVYEVQIDRALDSCPTRE
jgi:uncharacterized protein (TIGR00296 family)